MPVVDTFSKIFVMQTTTIPAERPVGREGEEDLVIVVKFGKPCYSRRSLSDPVHLEIGPILQADMFIPFSSIKQTCNEAYYRGMMERHLLVVGVPETLHAEILDKLFPVIYAAETYEVPILVVACDGTYRRESDEVLSFTPTAESAIEGLEKVRLDAAIIGQSPMCAIRWKDFAPEDDVDQLMVTRMPCSHCHHGDCIVRWLRVNHRCPMCRYPMPVETQPPSSSSNPPSSPPN